MPEGEEEEQEIENLFEKIMKNFPNLVKEIDFQEAQEAQRVPKKLNPRKHTPRHIIITLHKIKEKERILKAAREKEAITCKGVPIRLSADFSSDYQLLSHKTISCFFRRNLEGKKGLERSIQSHEGQGPTSTITLSSRAII